MSRKIIPKTELIGGDFVAAFYPVLISEIAKRGIKKKRVAQSIGVCYKSLNNKLTGKSPFTWPEVKSIRRQFFPDITPDELFSTEIEQDNKK